MRIQFDKGTVCINTKKGYREIRFGYQQPMYWSKNFYYKVTKSIKLWLFYTSHDTMKGLWEDVFIRVLGFSILFRRYI